MKKLLVFIFALFCSKIAMADGGIPLLIFVGSNFFITGNIIPPFIWGILLFVLVCWFENRYLIKQLKPKKKILTFVIKANLVSTLCGVFLTQGLGIIQGLLCSLPIPVQHGHPGEWALGCVLAGPVVILKEIFDINNVILVYGLFFGQFIIYMFLFGWVSWLAEYHYLKEKLHNSKLRKTLAFANFYSYLGLIIIFLTASIIQLVITEHKHKVALKAYESCETTCKVYASKTNAMVQSWEKKGFFCKCDVINKKTQEYGSHIVVRQKKTAE